jgi:phospholipid/cholesterol/gamma-HCH transport system substrate-binding protein
MVETIVGGVVVLVAVIFLLFGYLSTSNMPAGGGLVYKAVFDSVDGISVNSEVKIGGVCVGYVSSIDFDESYRVVVSMRIKKSVRLPDDSSVTITSSGLMGDKFVAVEPGASEDLLSAGETFVYAKSPLNLESLINRVISVFAKKEDAA